MIRKLVAALTLFVATANVSFAVDSACDLPDSFSATSVSAGSESTISSLDPSLASQHPDGDDCGDTRHHPQTFHNCHFGHCGAVMTFAKFSPCLTGVKHSFVLLSAVPNSFVANLLRPPIA